MSAGLIKPNSTFSFTVSRDETKTRLDTFISKQFPLYSRSYFQRLIEDGLVTINDKQLRKTSIALKEHDVISVTFPAEKTIDRSAISAIAHGVEIVHEETHFLVLYKPAGLNVHPPHVASTEASLVDYLLANYEEIKLVGYIDRPGIVHRLDKDTSGLIIIARTNHAHTVFGEKFHNRTIHKTYLAVVQGHPEPEGTIDLAIGRDPHVPVRMRAFEAHLIPDGSTTIRSAVSHYKVLEYFEDCALVEIKPVTGRTHQIRVHMAAIGHPIVGDAVYGKKSKLIGRQALHAYELAFEFDGKSHLFQKEMPADMQALIAHLKK